MIVSEVSEKFWIFKYHTTRRHIRKDRAIYFDTIFMWLLDGENISPKTSVQLTQEGLLL